MTPADDASAEYVSSLPLSAIRGAARFHGMSAVDWVERRANGLKWCSACQRWQGVAEFQANQSKPDGLNHSCRMKYRAFDADQAA